MCNEIEDKKNRIYVLQEDCTKRTICVSEDILLIQDCLRNEKRFHPFCWYPVLSIWENGKLFNTVSGGRVLGEVNSLSYNKN